MVIKVKKNRKRINISVDAELLDKAKKKLNMFGGKISTMFNAYLTDFVSSMEKNYSSNQKSFEKRINELEKKLDKLEKKDE